MAAIYATITDAEEMYDIDFLLRFASIKGDSQTLDLEKFNKNLKAASGRIDSYLSFRFDLPLQHAPEFLKEACVDIAIYRMCATASQLTEIIENRYKDAIEHLNKIANGKVGLGVSLDETSGEEGGRADGKLNPDQDQNKTFFTVRTARR